MKASLFFSYYPVNSDIATLVLKSPESFFRINHLWKPRKLLADLEEICTRIGRGKHYQVDLELKDKGKRKWLLAFSFADRNANMMLSELKLTPAKNVRFSWSGSVNQFVLAVAHLLMNVR